MTKAESVREAGAVDAGAVPTAQTRIVLVRHGQTEYNREGRWQGSGTDVPLNDGGRAEAERVAEVLAERFGGRVTAVYTSDLERALETARIVAARFGLEVVDEPALRELSHGIWEGRTHAEVEARWPEELAAYQADPYHVQRGGGDSYEDLEARLWPALERLADRHRGERIVAVSHGGPIRLALCRILNFPLNDRDALGVVNGAWFEVSRSPAGWSLVQRGGQN
ncbi:MAG TPA: histidine phosphatase family protein [Gemmatimonadota bacterium]|nr:histidine phosphatase family protein [Gemmatimonadota bacterium]